MLGDSGGMFAEIPKVLQPVSRFSVIKWGFDGVLASEFSGLRFTCDLDDDALDDDSAIAREVRRRMCIETGEDVLESMGLAPASITSAAVNQAKLILYNLGATYVYPIVLILGLTLTRGCFGLQVHVSPLRWFWL